MLQETHSTLKEKLSWDKQLGKQYVAYYSHSYEGKSGVITYIPKRLDKCVIYKFSDDKGRFLVLQLEIGKKIYTLINVYAPTQNFLKEQLEFLDNLENLMVKFQDTYYIIAGDFNIAPNPELDRWKPINLKPSPAAVKLIGLCSRLNLVDVWRQRNPTVKRYTWRRTNPFQQSRIDYFLISDVLNYEVDNADINPGIQSDHSVTTLSTKSIEQQQRGRGYWKLNNSLLSDVKYVTMIEEVVQQSMADLSDSDPKLRWDVLKMIIRRETIRFSTAKAKNTRKYRDALQQQLRSIEDELSQLDEHNEDLEDQYRALKEDWEMLEKDKMNGAILRSKARWTEEGEKNSKFFLNLEHHNQEVKNITSLLNTNGAQISEPNEILEYITMFYKNLYAPVSEKKFESINECTFASDTKLNQSDSDMLDKPITENDLYESLSDLPNNKTPGSDGLTVEFYKKFWKIIKEPLCDCIKTVYETGELTVDQRRGVINLIPKADKDLRNIKNWRPISILNVDYKLITKALALRLKVVLPDLIDGDQCGYVMNRLIGENIRIVSDLINYCQNQDVEGLLVFLDFEKAFDSLSWDFIDHTLSEFNFGPVFKKWISIIYTNITSAVLNHGHLSKGFSLTRGIRQGCPISAYIFILCAELLAQRIRSEESIIGLSIANVHFKILQFADDTVLILNNIESLRGCLSILNDFALYSGLRLNTSKSEVFALGNKDDVPGLSRLGLKITKGAIRYLGIWFEKDVKEMEYKNFRHRLEKIKNLLRLWLQRDLSLKGKITVLKALAMSQLIFPLTMLNAPHWVIEEANTIFFKFLWDGKPDKIKRSTILRQIYAGGLKMIDIDCMARALKVSWLKKFYEDVNRKWTIIPSFYFKELNMQDFCLSNYDETCIPYDVPVFYRQSLYALAQLKPVKPLTSNDILNQSLWLNTNLIRGGQTMFSANWYSQGIKVLADIIDSKGEFLLPAEISSKYNVGVPNFLDYLGLRHAVPYEWKSKLRRDMPNTTDIYNHPMLNIKDKLISLRHTTTNQLYWELLNQKCIEPLSCETFWRNTGLIGQEGLKAYFTIPFECISECKVQSLQYKIIHGFYPCRLRLKQWRIIESDLCLYCDRPDNLLHHFVGCDKMVNFWNSFANWWSTLCKKCDVLSDRDVLLGRKGKKCHTLQLNFTIMYAKWYIYKTKYLELECFFLQFLPDLKYRLLMEEKIYMNQARYPIFANLWMEILNSI